MDRFFIYKDYGAKYEMMIHDIASAPEAMPAWQPNQRGLEVLGLGMQSHQSPLDENKKSLSVGDLLVKVCRYSIPIRVISDTLWDSPFREFVDIHCCLRNYSSTLQHLTALTHIWRLRQL